MCSDDPNALEQVFPACRAALGPKAWRHLLASCKENTDRAHFPFPENGPCPYFPDYLPDLARLEWLRHTVAATPVPPLHEGDAFALNPTLELVRLPWRLSPLLVMETGAAPPMPLQAEEHVMVWRMPETGQTCVAAATDADLLTLKVLAEDMPLPAAAAAAGVPLTRIERALYAASAQGFVLAPPSRIRRDPALFPVPAGAPEDLVCSNSFLIQWHITHACDLRCKHCYDRSRRSPLTLEQGVAILDDLLEFCRTRRVRGHVCFSGGNPFLHPRFFDLYRAAAERDLPTSVLGNPAPRAQVRQLLAIQPLQYFQVSLEGLPEHNDAIRGAGHFARTIEFLGVLRDLGVSSTVMLTLTRDNMGQVLELAERLRGHAGHFTFNRLAQVGEGANLALPTPAEYDAFLDAYLDAAEGNPLLGLKDNLINVARARRGLGPCSGCTGFGCGAAFNFVAVLPDGEVHACRKFPSPIGNVLTQKLGVICDGEAARRYRGGSAACSSCRLRLACGGCMAVAHGRGLDVFRERDPFCRLDAGPPAQKSPPTNTPAPSLNG